MITHRGLAIGLLTALFLPLAGCTSDDSEATATGGNAGTSSGGGTGGIGGSPVTGGTAGNGGAAGSTGATGGSAGSGGAAGGGSVPVIASCSKLLSDTTAHTPPTLAMPAYLASVVDPVFGTKITRVTGEVGQPIPNVNGAAGNWRPVGGPGYSKRPSWNADQSLLQMTSTSAPGTLLLDANDYKVVAYPGGPSVGGERRWHPTDPKLMVWVANDGRAGFWNVLDDTVTEKFKPSTTLKDCRMGPWEGNVSLDGNTVVVSCDINAADPFFFAVDLQKGTQSVTIKTSDLGFDNLDWASISPKGDYIVASQNWQEQRTLTFTDSSFKVVASWQNMGHYDLGLDVNGEQVAANASGWMARLSDGLATTILKTGADDYHTSTRNLLAPGWSFNSLYNTTDLFANELWAMELGGSKRIRRIAHHRSTGSDYDRAPFGSASPDGTRVFYRSDWGDASGPVYGFVADIREVCK